jgi:hypothetical protein
VAGDIELLAALLAHEGQHFDAQSHDEPPAYQRQLDVLQRLGYDNQAYMAALQQRIAERTHPKP